jgi:hypothetical protein
LLLTILDEQPARWPAADNAGFFYARPEGNNNDARNPKELNVRRGTASLTDVDQEPE